MGSNLQLVDPISIPVILKTLLKRYPQISCLTLCNRNHIEEEIHNEIYLFMIKIVLTVAAYEVNLIYRVFQKSWAHFDVEYVKNYQGNNNTSDIF